MREEGCALFDNNPPVAFAGNEYRSFIKIHMVQLDSLDFSPSKAAGYTESQYAEVPAMDK